jgi:hypothetical protein
VGSFFPNRQRTRKNRAVRMIDKQVRRADQAGHAPGPKLVNSTRQDDLVGQLLDSSNKGRPSASAYSRYGMVIRAETRLGRPVEDEIQARPGFLPGARDL